MIALFISILLLFSVSIAEANTDVFKTKVKMDIGWFNLLAQDESEAAMSISELSQWSNLVAPYLQLVLSNYERQANTTDIIDVAVTVNDQTTSHDTGNGASVGIACTIQVWYMGEEVIKDLDKIFDDTLVSENGVEVILRDVALVGAGSAEIRDFYINITADEIGSQLLYTVIPIFNYGAAQQGLVVACTFLVLSLLFVSGVVIWMAGGCPILYTCLKNPTTCCTKDQTSDAKSDAKSEEKPDHKSYRRDRKHDRKLLSVKGDSMRFDSVRFDGDDTTTASGILGALPSYDTVESSNSGKSGKENERQRIGYSDGVGLPPGTLPVGFTPKRSVFREQDCDDSQIMTPMSTNTDYSAAGVVPLGIAPTGGNLKYRSSPDKQMQQNREVASPGYLGRLNYY